MFRLAAVAYARLSPEAQVFSEQFLRALPPFARRQIQGVRLFGSQARRFEPGVPFDLLVTIDQRTLELKTALAVAQSALEGDGVYEARVTIASSEELLAPSPQLARVLQNARREGVDLWTRPAPVEARSSL